MLRNTRKELRGLIGKAKKAAWEELIIYLNRDPWRRSHKIVMKKISQENAGICEKMEGGELRVILDGLFPGTEKTRDIRRVNEELDTEFPEVTAEEVVKCSKRIIKKGIRAPGPVG